MSIAVGNIEIYMGPDSLEAPDDLEAVILQVIEGARDILDIAVQERESRPITQAIIDGRGTRPAGAPGVGEGLPPRIPGARPTRGEQGAGTSPPGGCTPFSCGPTFPSLQT